MDAVEGSRLNVYDFLAVALYFVLVLIVGVYSMCRSNRGTVSGYFLAGRFMVWLPVGASLFASNIGSEHFIGLAGSGAAGGIGVGAFEFNACLLLQLLGWFFLPVFIASKVSTLPEFMSKRFGGNRIRTYLAVLSLALYIFTKISVNMYSGSLFIKQSLGWNLYYSILLLLLMTAICTVTGGLAAVIYTDTLQFFIMIAGASYIAVRAYIEVGGYEALQYKYMRAIPDKLIPNTTCGYPRNDSWIMLRDPVNSDMPWPGFLFGQTPASIWYWCSDQMMVQRALSAKSLSHAQGATLLAGYVKMLPLFIMVIPGMISRVLYKDRVGCVDPDECFKVCGNRKGCSNIAYPELVLGLMPIGFRGIMLAVMLAALMSDLTSIFNSASTLFTMDIWPQFRKNPGTKELLLVGRIFCLVMIAISIVWIPVIEAFQGAQLFIYIQVVSAYLAPPIASVYLFALLWKRMNEKGAFAGLISGLVVGVVRMVLDFYYQAPACGEPDDRPPILSRLHYMYFALILFWITFTISAIVSLLTEPPPEYRAIRTTYWTRFDNTIREDDAHNFELHEINERLETQAQNPSVMSPKKSAIRRGYDWFCGFEDSDEGLAHAVQLRDHIERISNLKQNKWAKIFLNANLIVLILATIFVYVYFSVDDPLS
ncbi:SLC5A3 (predicted) [Pycnogonum litorale]